MPTDDTEIKNELGGRCVAPIFKSLSTAGHTGIFTVQSGPRVQKVLLRGGQPVFAASNDREVRLNGVLIRLGFVTLPDLVRAIERMPKEDRRLGEILVLEGLLDRDRVAEALRIQLHEILYRVLVHQQGQYAFHERSVPQEDIGFTPSVNSLIREALFRITTFHRIMDEIGGLSAVYAKTERFDEEVASTGFSSFQRDILPLFEKGMSLEQLCLDATYDDFDVCRFVWVLLSIGALSRLE